MAVRFLPDDYGYYRCSVCGHNFNRDEVTEIKQTALGVDGKPLIIFYHVCDGCDSKEKNHGVIKEEK